MNRSLALLAVLDLNHNVDDRACRVHPKKEPAPGTAHHIPILGHNHHRRQQGNKHTNDRHKQCRRHLQRDWVPCLQRHICPTDANSQQHIYFPSTNKYSMRIHFSTHNQQQRNHHKDKIKGNLLRRGPPKQAEKAMRGNPIRAMVMFATKSPKLLPYCPNTLLTTDASKKTKMLVSCHNERPEHRLSHPISKLSYNKLSFPNSNRVMNKGRKNLPWQKWSDQGWHH